MSVPPADDPLLGTTVAGRYRVRRVVGEGGMGRVYLARQDSIEKDVALKVLLEEYSYRADVVLRFQQEAKSASRIKHPNVIAIYDFGQLPDGRFYLAAEFLEGHDLAHEIQKNGRPSVERSIEILLILCDALEAAHERGVVHRDMKPENIFLENGEVKIVDFGIAKLREMREELSATSQSLGATTTPGMPRITRYGTICGTPEYMAPEQAAGQEVDGRADVYACGAILFELLTGKVPFQGATVVDTLMMHLANPPPRPNEVKPALNLSRELEDVVIRALGKRPDDRFPTMGAFAEALVRTPEGRLLAHRLRRRPASELPIPLVASPIDRASAETVDEAPPKRSLLPAALGVLLVLGLAGGAAVWLSKRASPQLTPATSAHASAQPPVPAARSAAPSASVEASPPPGASVAPVAMVRLSVQSDPAGALVRREGFQVCDATPCEVTVKEGEPVELVAELRDLRGTAKILATADQTVKIRLAKQGAAPPPKPGTAAPPATTTATEPPKPKMCEVLEGDLKVLRPCK